MEKNIVKQICECVDHTNLKKTATTDDIRILCEDAIKNNAASVCVQPCYVSLASKLLKNKKPLVCTVIGFPNGYNTTNVKKYETRDAILAGADEIDMVLNVAWLKEKRYAEIEKEIKELAKMCHEEKYFGKRATLKVIIETCLLTKDEIKKMCEICIKAGADFIKTSTGFDKAGANVEDIKLMKETINGRPLKIKAAGGIRTLADAKAMIDAGADRIGASALFAEVKNLEKLEEDLER